MKEIKVPIIPNAGTRLSIGRWFKRSGDPVTVHQPLVEIDTDNVTHEIRAPVTGVLSKIFLRDDATVEPGTVLCTITVIKCDRAVSPPASSIAGVIAAYECFEPDILRLVRDPRTTLCNAQHPGARRPPR